MMAQQKSVNLFKDEGEEYRSVDLSVEPNETIRIMTTDMGPRVEEIQGDFDFEFWINIPQQSQTKLLFALLKDKYRGRAEAVVELRAFCDSNAIEHQSGYYI